jgi:hypothetical protein
MQQTLIPLLFGSLAVVAVAAPAEVPVPADAVTVRACGAVGDGQADDTEAFLRAVEQGRRDGRHVYVPRGAYVLSRPLALENMALTGPAAGAWPADIDALPALLPAHRDGPAIHLLAGGSVSGVDITYRWNAEPESGPAAVLISGIGATVRNVRIRYPWDGILTDGENNVGRLNIENVFMVAPRNVGVRVTGTWDVPRLCNIEVWNAGPVPRGLEKGIGFHLGKNDLIRLTDCFAFAMQCGFLLEESIEGAKIEGGTWGVMNGCATDYCSTGIVVRGDHTLSVAGGSFWNHHTSLVVDGKGARVRVSGSELKSNGAPVVHVRNSDHVLVTGCSLLRPMAEHAGPGVLLEGGTTALGNNQIQCFGEGVRVLPGVRAAMIQGNLIDSHGQAAVSTATEGRAQIQVEGNLVSAGASEEPRK